ncbi:MAG: glycosyltransferase [Candidatus Caldarchaeum sp.]
MTKISIITPTLNRAALLKEAIHSVLIQNFDDLEHIIIDNGSEDGTVEMVDKLSSEYGHIKLLTEPVRNYARAFNTGLKAATGEIIIYLADDDLLPPHAVHCIHTVHELDKPDIIAGGATVLKEAAGTWVPVKEVYPKCSLYHLLFHTPYEPSKIVRRTMIERVGYWNDEYGFAAHREWLIRLVVSGAKVKHINKVIYLLRAHKGSATLKQDQFKALGWIPAHLKIARKYLTTIRDEEAKKLFKEWSNRQAIFGAKLAVKKNQLRKALSILCAGLVNDPTMPIYWWHNFILRRIIRSSASE